MEVKYTEGQKDETEESRRRDSLENEESEIATHSNLERKNDR